MMNDALAKTVDELWESRADLGPNDIEARDVVFEVLGLLDRGAVRVAEVDGSDAVVVHEWIKKAILLCFRVRGLSKYEVGPFEFVDRLPLKKGFKEAGVRVLPGASARFGSFLARGVTLMPSYVNVGAYVGERTMVDTWATVGSCAQIGSDVHLSGGVGIGGVLEPPQAVPVIVQDNAFIGSRAMVTEGAFVGEGAVLGAGVILNPSIPVIDVETGEELSRGRVPAWSVCISGTRPRVFNGGTYGLPAVLVIRRLAEGERHDKTALNAILRDHGAAV